MTPFEDGKSADACDRNCALSRSNITEFRERGFTIVPNVIAPRTLKALKNRYPRLFAGKFEYGYPDDWAWRPDFGSPVSTRFLVNAWKCDRLIANLVFYPTLAKAAAELANWSGARIANDQLWWKPPGTYEIAFHQDATEWMPFLTPSDMVTCWIALDDCTPGAGTLQFVPGSHKWPLIPESECDISSSSGPDYQRFMEASARRANISGFEVIPVVGDAGLCVFHSGLVWHGSEANCSKDRSRRSIAIHFLQAETKYSDGTPRFIFARYKRDGDRDLDERHFPIVWSKDGYCSPVAFSARRSHSSEGP